MGGSAALAVGLYDDGTLKYAGRVGTGFTEAELKRLGELLKPRHAIRARSRAAGG